VFAGVAMLISVIGIGAVLAFSVSGRRREFGVRLAIGAPPMQLLLGVLRQGLVMAAAGIACGAFVGWALSTLAGAYVAGLEFPGAMALAGAAALLVAATVVASLVPAIRAGRTDPTLALRAE
jgi:ABC-type antimicrobial peptide transport system permease subunit